VCPSCSTRNDPRTPILLKKCGRVLCFFAEHTGGSADVIAKTLRALISGAAVALTLATGTVARAQAPVDPATPLPAGHPAVGSDAPTNQPEEPSEPSEGDGADQAQAMPPGHPGADRRDRRDRRRAPPGSHVARAGSARGDHRGAPERPGRPPHRLHARSCSESRSRTSPKAIRTPTGRATTDARGIFVFDGHSNRFRRTRSASRRRRTPVCSRRSRCASARPVDSVCCSTSSR